VEQFIAHRGSVRHVACLVGLVRAAQARGYSASNFFFEAA
jgi:hypothetical protein